MSGISGHPDPIKTNQMSATMLHRKTLMTVVEETATRNKIMGIFSLVYLLSIILFVGGRGAKALSQSFDYEAHFQYLDSLLAGRYPKISETYTACHFPVFYEMHLVPAKVLSLLPFNAVQLVLVSMVFQALIQIVTLYALYNTCLLLIKNKLYSLICCFAIFTSLPVLHLPLNWNQDVYIFFFSCIALNVFIVGCLQKFDFVKVTILGVLFLIGTYFKITMLIVALPIMAVIFLITKGRERVHFMGILLSAVLLPLFFLFFRGDYLKSDCANLYLSYYQGMTLNKQMFTDAYLNFDFKLFIEKDYYPFVNKIPEKSVLTNMYHDLFALVGYNYLRGFGFFSYAYIAGLWTGSILFFFFLKKVVVKLLYLDIVEICLLLILLLGTVLYFAFSLNLPFLWEPHIEYILIIIPCVWLFLFKNLEKNTIGQLIAITAIGFITSNTFSWFYGLFW